MSKVNIHLAFVFALLSTQASYAQCKSFSFGVNSPNKNEFAFFECKTKQVFQNSDLFNTQNAPSFFIGESLLNKKVNYKKINKIINSIAKKSKEKSMKSMFSSHNLHLTIDKKSYQISKKNFDLLKEVLNHLRRKSITNNGILVKKKKIYRIKNKTNAGLVDVLKLKTTKDHYFFSGLYWRK